MWDPLDIKLAEAIFSSFAINNKDGGYHAGARSKEGRKEEEEEELFYSFDKRSDVFALAFELSDI